MFNLIRLDLKEPNSIPVISVRVEASVSIHFLVPEFRRFIAAVKMDSTQLCLLAFVLGSLMTVGSCGNYTVTDEAWFEVEIKDFEGQGLHYKGIFTIALFGESAPMTVMNFAAIVRGYKRGK